MQTELHAEHGLEKLSNATRLLSEAKTLDEIKQIVDIAEAARVYARAAKLGLEAYNHAAEVKVRAERKAGALLAQLERSLGGRPKNSFQIGTSSLSPYADTLEEHEIPRTTSFRWQKVAAIPEEDFEQQIITLKGEHPISTSRLLKAVHVSHNSGENEWYTPPEYIAAARAVLGDIDFDPASSAIANTIVQAKHFLTAEDDALGIPWPATRIWMNPPYAQPLIGAFIHCFVDAVTAGAVGIALVNNATETTWFQSLAASCRAICFPKGRVRFLDPEGRPGAPLQGQACCYAGPDVAAFQQHFGPFGLLMEVSHASTRL